MNVFELEATITLNGEDYVMQLKDAEKASEETEKKAQKNAKEIGSQTSFYMSQAFQTISNFAGKVGGVIDRIAISAFNGIKKLASIGGSYNMMIENYTTDFTTMLGSAEKAQQRIAELADYANKTPFELTNLADAEKTLLQYQVTASETQDVITMLSDVSLGNANKLQSLALVYGQISSLGKLQGQDWKQLINQGYNPLNDIAKRTGETMEQLQDRMSKGQISIEEVKQAFKDATSEGGMFFKGTERGSLTLQGRLSTLKGSFQSKLGDIFSSLSEDVLPDLIGKAQKFVDTLDAEKIANDIKDFMPTLQGIGNTILDFTNTLTKITTFLINHKGLLITILSIVAALRTAIKGLEIAGTIASTINSLKSVTDAMTAATAATTAAKAATAATQAATTASTATAAATQAAAGGAAAAGGLTLASAIPIAGALAAAAITIASTSDTWLKWKPIDKFTSWLGDKFGKGLTDEEEARYQAAIKENERRKAEQNINVTVNNTTTVDGKQVAESTADYLAQFDDQMGDSMITINN